MKKIALALMGLVCLGGLMLWQLPPRYAGYLTYNLHKQVALFSPNVADGVFGTSAPKVFRRYLNEKALAAKVSSAHPWVEQVIKGDFAKHTKFSVSDIQQTFDAFEPGDNLTIFTVRDGAVTIQNKFPQMNEACKYALNLYQEIFTYIARKGYVSNVTFVMRLSDKTETNMKGKTIKDIAPILAVTKDTNHPIDQASVLIPDWQNLDGWPPLIPLMDQRVAQYPWDKKLNTIFWRGGPADATGYRHAIVDMSKKLSYEKIDAQFTYGPLATVKWLNPEDHVKYKFQLTMDGHTAAWQRPVWQLYSGCVMIKQASPLVQWYYDAIKPGVHYIEVGQNPQELLTVLNKYSDVELKSIGDKAHTFVKENLTLEDMVAHIILVLQRYEKLQQQTSNRM